MGGGSLQLLYGVLHGKEGVICLKKVVGSSTSPWMSMRQNTT